MLWYISCICLFVYMLISKDTNTFSKINLQIRVSSKISNGQIVLNLDCDMYSNDPLTVRDALCFFMDEEKSHDIAFVQFPQWFANVTKNDLYSSSLRVITNVSIIYVACTSLFNLLIFQRRGLRLVIGYFTSFSHVDLEGGIPWYGWLWRPSLCWDWLLSQERYSLWKGIQPGF